MNTETLQLIVLLVVFLMIIYLPFWLILPARVRERIAGNVIYGVLKFFVLLPFRVVWWFIKLILWFVRREASV
ncbi:MAG: hypothetical protein D6723_16760 [Acidobacteria bacterium]|nr:MAG: hypothetical protein D6723_16760 [Acidobacteriota bacterium]